MSYKEWVQGYIDRLNSDMYFQTTDCVYCGVESYPVMGKVFETVRGDIYIPCECGNGHQFSKIVYQEELKRQYNLQRPAKMVYGGRGVRV
jgi:hypothetical protein